MKSKGFKKLEKLIRDGMSAEEALKTFSLVERAEFILEIRKISHIRATSEKQLKSGGFISYSDGASRGNPGEAGYGFVIEKDGTVIEEGCGYLGVMTNNQAEYHGLINVLKKAAGSGITDLTVRMDSELIVKQMQGAYKVKNSTLKILHEEAVELCSLIRHCRFEHVKRSFNGLADALANKAIDEK